MGNKLGNWRQRNHKIKELENGEDVARVAFFTDCTSDDIKRICNKSGSLRSWLAEQRYFAEAIRGFNELENLENTGHNSVRAALRKEKSLLRQVFKDPFRFQVSVDDFKAAYQNSPPKDYFLKLAKAAYKKATSWWTRYKERRYARWHKGQDHPEKAFNNLIRAAFEPVNVKPLIEEIGTVVPLSTGGEQHAREQDDPYTTGLTVPRNSHPPRQGGPGRGNTPPKKLDFDAVAEQHDARTGQETPLTTHAAVQKQLSQPDFSPLPKSDVKAKGPLYDGSEEGEDSYTCSDDREHAEASNTSFALTESTRKVGQPSVRGTPVGTPVGDEASSVLPSFKEDVLEESELPSFQPN